MPIVLDDVSFSYGDRVIVDRRSASLAEGRLTGIVGPSGSGKSTFLGLVSGELRSDGGRITYPSSLGSGSSPPGHLIGWVMQTTNVFPRRSVLDNVALPARLAGRARDDAKAAALDALDLVGLAAFGHRRCASLSGGERQRVAVARAVAADAPLLIADEPTASLDRANRDQLTGILVAVARQGAIVVVATHDAAVAGRCDELIEL
jgi:ABC-type lipoprotein export system ATPase subunit